MALEPTIGRRALLGIGAASVASACTPSRSTPQAHRSPASTRSAAPTAPVLPAFVAWRPSAGEEEVGAKTAAVRHIERAGNAPGHRLQVIDAQYGGLLDDRASVLVVCESWTVAAGRPLPDGHTYDVRVNRAGAAWTVTAVYPSTPGAAVTRPGDAARSVLANARIRLPPAAQADVESGQVHDSVLEAMLTVAKRWTIAVSVIRSGHPLYVFGTSRLSDHPHGRAFDTWAIDDIPVVAAGAPKPVIPAYMEALASIGSYNIGGPVLLGTAPQFFSDRTHHDHVHAGFLT